MWLETAYRFLKEHLTITVPGVVLVFAATYIVMLAVKAGEAGAAWVQAIGAIGMIGVAVWLPWAEERRRRRQADVSQSKRLVLIAIEAEVSFKNFASYKLSITTTRETVRELISPLQSVLPRLDALVIDDDDPERLAVAYEIRQAISDVNAYIASIPLLHTAPKRKNQILDALVSARKRAEKIFNDVAVSRRSVPQVE